MSDTSYYGQYDPATGVPLPQDYQATPPTRIVVTPPQPEDANRLDPPAPEQAGVMSRAVNRLLGVNGEERYQTWPERMVRSGFTAPGDAVSGDLPMVDPETGHTSEAAIQRAQDTAGLAMTGGLAGTGEGGMVAGSGPVRTSTMRNSEIPTATAREQQLLRQAVRESGDDRSFHEHPRQEVPIKDLVATQDEVNPEIVQQKIQDGEYKGDNDAFAVLHDGKYYIEDGHHTVEAARRMGRDTVPMHVQVLNAKNPEDVFRSKLKGQDFYHESPGDVADSMRQNGIEGDYGTFATVGQPSGFVTTPQKTVVRFQVPDEHLHAVGPDMRYDPDAPFEHLMREHPEVKGADVSFPDNIPPSWIKSIQVLNAKNDAAAPLSALEKRGPIWHSPVENALEQSTTGSAPGKQWLATLQNARGVKPEELDWTGLREFLISKRDEKVTRQELHEHLDQNRVQLRDVDKGGIPPEELPQHRDALAQQDYGYNYAELPENYRRQVDEDIATKSRGTKYHDYQLPGGENYREHLLTLPAKNYDMNLPENQAKFRAGAIPEQQYKSSHWDEPNIVAHVRTNDRMMEDPAFRVVNRRSNNTSEAFKTRAEAEAYQARLPEAVRGQTEITDKAIIPRKTLHIEEVQSDWHQAGRKSGYAQDLPRRTFEARKNPNGDGWLVFDSTGDQVSGGGLGKADAERLAVDFEKQQATRSKGVPDAPFKTSWPELAMKRMVRRAAEEGYDRISWTPGEAQAARYDLSKQVDKLSYDPKTGQLRGWKNGEVNIRQTVPAEKLADHVGKDVAQKLVDQPLKPDPAFQGATAAPVHSLEGQQLSVGGEGMREFYDKMLPKVAEKIGKAHGVKVQRGELPGSRRNVYEAMSENGMDTQQWNKLSDPEKLKLLERKQPVHYFDLPQSLKDQALQKGMPLFSGGRMFVPATAPPEKDKK